MTEIEKINQLLEESSDLPWALVSGVYHHGADEVPVPTHICSRHRTILSEEAGLCHGLSDDTIAEIRANAQVFALSKELITVLLRSLLDAAGSKDKAEFLISHHTKALGQEIGEIPRSQIFQK